MVNFSGKGISGMGWNLGTTFSGLTKRRLVFILNVFQRKTKWTTSYYLFRFSLVKMENLDPFFESWYKNKLTCANSRIKIYVFWHAFLAFFGVFSPLSKCVIGRPFDFPYEIKSVSYGLIWFGYNIYILVIFVIFGTANRTVESTSGSTAQPIFPNSNILNL